jgi:hypothetical protein
MPEEKKEGLKDEIIEGVEKIEKAGKGILAKLGFWLFLVGVIIAILAGIWYGYDATVRTQDIWGYIATTLAILGFLVGLISAIGLGTITEYEVTRFLVASVAVVVVGAGGSVAFGDIPLVGSYFQGVTLSLLLFFAPASVILALKALWDIGKD